MVDIPALCPPCLARLHFILANPSGLWALAAAPLVVLIYFLQERTRRVTVSTLFLLERVKPESIGGRKFERLRHSWPMWLQILAVALLAWILAEPRWIRPHARQDVVFLLDGSASMSAFKEETRDLLRRQIRAWDASGIQTRWHLLDTDPKAAALFSGSDIALLLGAFDSWQPALGTHDFTPAISTARGLMREGSGVVVLFTDRKTTLPADVAVVSAGEPLENCGFAGVTLDDKNPEITWRALVRNHGRQAQRRSWWVEIPGEEPSGSAKRSFELAPGETIALEGVFPRSSDRCEIVIEGDRFALDDRMPLVRPKPRKVRIGFGIFDERRDVLKRVLSSLPHVQFDAEDHDLWIGPWENPEGVTSAEPAHEEILLPRPTEGNPPLDSNRVAAEDHPLTRDLNWMALLGPGPRKMTRMENDTPLLWQGTDTAAILRTWPRHRQLLLNLDIMQGNAPRVPAFVVLLHRFVEQVRQRAPGERFENLECGQSLAGSLPPAGGQVLALRGPGGKSVSPALRAPAAPGFFEVTAEKEKLLTAAAFFADAREADFTKAEPLDTTASLRSAARLINSEDDRWKPLWITLAAACLMGAWALQGRARKAGDMLATPGGSVA